MEPKIRVKGKRRNCRSKRGSGITKKNPIEVAAVVEDDDDPFVDCDSQRWSLKTALEYIDKFHSVKVNINTAGFKGPVNASTFDLFSNTLVISLFRLYGKLETKLQNSLHTFYFDLENSHPSRFRNITHCLHRQNIFHTYPWLTKDEKLREPVDVKELYKKRRNKRNNSEAKPFSEACKQYEKEKEKCSKIQTVINNVKIEPEVCDITMNQNLYLHDVNIPNSSHNKFNIDAIESKIPITQNDNHLLLSQEYKNMITAINCNYQCNSDIDERINSKQFLIEEIPQITHSGDSSKRKTKKRSRWSSPTNETNAEIPILKTNKITYNQTPMMHFVNRKIKLTTQTPLSLGDLIVLVSFYYKLEYIEQQLLIEKMKTLEATKPHQAAYLRQYVRTTCPLYNENEIQFKPLPEELITSELNMDLHDVTCIEDILEKDFCVSDDLYLKRIKTEHASRGCLDNIKQATSKEFDFGSAFL